ncbi:MAG: type IV pili methyl-accepting chemotaxis transducer N-terminal domain-containing protein [Pseudomonadota bacterium]
MTSVLLLQTTDTGAPDLRADFTSAGFSVTGPADGTHLVREALRAGADVVACWAPRVDDALLQAIATLQREQPTPVLVFTQDSDVDCMERALAAGVQAWVVQGYGAHRLRPLVAMAQARQRRERALAEQVQALDARLEERKLMDKAKGILMRSRDLSEDEAFRLLRSASMQGNQKVGQLSRQVIDAARVAQAINRAGQQRMLSQRLIKLYALACSRTDGPAAALLMRESIARVEDNLKSLESELSPATFGDLLAAGRAAWAELRQGLEAPPQLAGLERLDALAEAVLGHANALVLALEASGVVHPVHVVNQAGRQRMLSQRVAKLALLIPGAAQAAPLRAEMDSAARAFEEGMRVLEAAPLSTPETRAQLAQGRLAWTELLATTAQAGQAAGRLRVAAASEDLLTVFDRLTGLYQHSLQVLLGDVGAPGARDA